MAGSTPIIHLIDQRTCERAAPVAAHLADLARRDRSQRVVLVGRAHAARGVGLPVNRRVDVSPVAMGLARTKLWRTLRTMRADAPVVAWSEAALRLARRCGVDAIDSSGQPIVCDATRIDQSRRQPLRQAWGVGGDDRVVLVLGDRHASIDAAAGLVAIGLAAETGRPYRMLCHPRAAGLGRAEHVAEAMGRADRLIVDDRADQPWRVLPGADAALAVGDDGRRGVAWAEAARVPVISAIELPHPRHQAAALCRL
jgi:hypothetical protein